MRILYLPLATLVTAAVVACGGGSSATDPEPTQQIPTVTVTPSTPVPAPPWTTNSPATPDAESTGTQGAQPTVPEGSPGNTSIPSTPTVTSTEPPGATATPTSATTSAPLHVTVSVQDNKFVPSTVTIAAGGTVRWVVDGAAKHDVSGPGFDSGFLSPGESFEWTFADPGGYTYECEIHNIPGTAARMTARVIVE